MLLLYKEMAEECKLLLIMPRSGVDKKEWHRRVLMKNILCKVPLREMKDRQAEA